MQHKLLLQSLQFTGMGGPMGVYENYDTGICQDGGRHCEASDNEDFYGDPAADEQALAAGGGTFFCISYHCTHQPLRA